MTHHMVQKHGLLVELINTYRLPTIDTEGPLRLVNTEKVSKNKKI